MLKDLNRIRLLLRSNFPRSSVVDGMELMCCPGLNLEKAETAAIGSPGSLTRFIHPSGHTFAKMALNLIEAMAPTAGRWQPSREGSENTATLIPATPAAAEVGQRSAHEHGPTRAGAAITSPHQDTIAAILTATLLLGDEAAAAGTTSRTPAAEISADAVIAATGAAVECGAGEGDSEI
jgi:hypothetical protein